MEVTRRIQQLDPIVVNQIAAGEVIERPASVVKELLDNALDAGARRIWVDIAGGGRELIRVVDDGHGIFPQDLPLAFASHATSKLRRPEDLQAIRTMGFRGEALASIGSVAKVTLQSCAVGTREGGEIRCVGGEIDGPGPWTGQVGTRIEVRELFFNVPARREFLRSIPTEVGHISEAVIRLALGQPHLGIKLTHNGKDIYDLPASTPLTERIRLFFGKEVAEKVLPVDATAGPARLTGLIVDPAVDRGNARLQYLFVNGRWIRDRSLSHAIQEAYHGLLMTGRYALAFLFLELPPAQVDVNVHPTKAEVRFRDGQALHHFVRSTLRTTLNRHELVPQLRIPTQPTATTVPRFSAPPHDLWSLRPSVPPASPRFEYPHEAPSSAAPSRGNLPTVKSARELVAEVEVPTDPAPSSAAAEPTLNAIQLHNAYLVIETAEGMLVVDQHALHERILFEQFKTRVAEGPVESQRLLIPEPVDLPREEAGLLLEHAETLGRLGLEVEHFGEGTVIIRAYPAALHRTGPAELIQEVVRRLLNSPRAPTKEELQLDLLAMMACKAAVKAGDPLGPDEIAELLRFRHLAADTHHCPHGRPTSLYFSKHELDKQFQRV